MPDGRIATITFDWYPFDITTRRLAEAAVDGGFEVDVFCIRQADEPAFEVYNGVRIHRLPVHRGFGESLPSTLLGWSRFLFLAGAAVTRRHLARRYDIVHVHNMPDFLVFAALVPRLLGAKVILGIQDVSPELMAAKARGRKRAVFKRLAAMQEGLATRFADHVLTVGWPFERLLLRRGVPRHKLSVILNSADPKLFPAARRRPLAPLPHAGGAPFVVMYHGTLAERNGLDIALRAVALARAQAPEVRLHIMGRGEEVSALKRLAIELGIGDAVRFEEPRPAEGILDFLLDGDLGIIPYRSDGFAELVLPTKAYEYAWVRCPMIASDTTAIRSMFRPESLLLCDPARPETFAQAIIQLMRHPEERQRMCACAAADYEPYRWEHMSVDYLRLLKRLMTGMAARARSGAYGQA